MRRILTLVAVLAIVVATAAASWLAGSRIQSPAEAAARTAPPAPSPILVPVEERVLSSRLVTRGTARFGRPNTVSLVPSMLKSEVGIVTTLPERGSRFAEGEALLTASGRPVFVLQGEIPVFRDLGPGVFGEDVRQLEAALARLGFDPGSVDGLFDEQTGRAVTGWYAAAGWEVFGPTWAQRGAQRALEHELRLAGNERLAAEEAAAAGSLAVEAARVGADSAAALADSALAAADLAHARVLADPNAGAEERLRSQAELVAAQAAAQASRLEGELAIRLASDAQRASERAVALATARETDLAADLERVRSEIGVNLPADEIVFVPTLPIRVEEIGVAVGGAAAGPVLKVTNDQLAIDSSLTLVAAPLVKPGMAVVIDEPDLGIAATGSVARVASIPGTDGVDGFHVYFETLVDDTPATLEGFSLRLTIPVESTGGAVLAVPISAVSLAADGSSTVDRMRGAERSLVVVTLGLAADGYVEVSSAEGGLVPGDLVVVGFETP